VSYSAVDAAHAEVFDLEEFLDAVFRAPVTRQMGPMPLSFMPPNGAISVEVMPSLMPTIPYSRASATRQIRGCRNRRRAPPTLLRERRRVGG